MPTEAAVQIALRTQQIIAHESGVTDTIDPLAGSYYIESLTDQLEAQAQAYINEIDRMGGALIAVEEGYIQQQIQEAAYHYQRDLEAKEQIVVGVNQFVQADEKLTIPTLQLDPAIEAAQCARIQELRSQRDNGKVAELRGQLETAARTDENLMPLFIACVENDVTLGEICHTLRGVWGEYRPS